MGKLIVLRVDEKTLHAATISFLRSNTQRRHEIEHLYHLLGSMGVVDPNGKPAILTADEDQRRDIYNWLVEHAGRA